MNMNRSPHEEYHAMTNLINILCQILFMLWLCMILSCGGRSLEESSAGKQDSVSANTEENNIHDKMGASMADEYVQTKIGISNGYWKNSSGKVRIYTTR
ncbi:hypothetical protein H8B06_02270 [Sphingobacterium sp. DN00404]|uniref:Uncharacterized protein n=1 Tax=Sphingobacterium micropteri TaxID=2763501 RepID=A0ABR7YK06_9SPHI|nr:hypothetical protein [Sphingobacterium micropteri]MBD1431637.1 hypothetical protein [Sphingobacterium micropteri]